MSRSIAEHGENVKQPESLTSRAAPWDARCHDAVWYSDEPPHRACDRCFQRRDVDTPSHRGSSDAARVCSADPSWICEQPLPAPRRHPIGVIRRWSRLPWTARAATKHVPPRSASRVGAGQPCMIFRVASAPAPRRAAIHPCPTKDMRMHRHVRRLGTPGHVTHDATPSDDVGRPAVTW